MKRKVLYLQSEMEQPAVAIAQVTPMLAKSHQGVQNAPAQTAVTPSEPVAITGTNVARVGPLSNQQSDSGKSGF